MSLYSIEEIEKKFLDCTAPPQPQAGSEELLLRLFREQDARMARRHHRARAYACTGLAAAAACLAFCAVAGLKPLPATHVASPQPSVSQAEAPAQNEAEEDIDSGIPEGTIDDIMSRALANAR